MPRQSAKQITLVNPSRRGKITAAELHAGLQGHGEQSYKGHLLVLNNLQNLWMIRKGGQHLSFAPTLTEAKKIVDLLVDPVKNPKGRKARKKSAGKSGYSLTLKATRQAVKPLAAWVFDTLKKEGKANTALIEHAILDFIWHRTVLKAPGGKS